MTIPNLSQSVLKDFYMYFANRECGKALYFRHYEKIRHEPSEVQKLGIYFEYLVTGYIPKGETVPEPKIVYKGTKNEGVAQAYKNAQESAQLCKQMLSAYGINILSVGEYILVDGCSGLLDIRGRYQGKEIIIDLKYTALMEDKFNDYGWHTESLVFKRHLLLQPTHYKYLKRKQDGIHNIPFYFWLFSSKDPKAAKIIHVNMEDSVIDEHEEKYVNVMKPYLAHYAEHPEKLEAKPTYLRCLDCPYNEVCNFKMTVPQIEEIQYSVSDM